MFTTARTLLGWTVLQRASGRRMALDLVSLGLSWVDWVGIACTSIETICHSGTRIRPQDAGVTSVD